MPFMDFLNQLAKGWNEGANQGLETDWATRQALEQKKKELETLFPIKLRQQGETLAQAEPFALRKIAAAHPPKTPTDEKETFHTVGKNLYGSKRGWIPGPTGATGAESPTQGINEIVGYDITKGPRADVPPAEQMEGFDQMAKPELMTAIKDRVKAGPTTNVTVQPTAGGNYGMRIAPAPVPAGDLNAWAQTETERLVNEEGWDRATARLKVSNLVSEMLAKRAGLRQGATTQAQITTEFGTPANVDTVAEGKAKIAGNVTTAQGTAGSNVELGLAPPAPPGSPERPPMSRKGAEAYEGAVGSKRAQSKYDAIAMNRPLNLVNDLDALSSRLMTVPKPGPLQWIQGGQNWLGATLKYNQTAQAYQQTTKSILGELARQVSQERGVLTNQDIDRIEGGLPTFTDTKPVRDFKIGRIRSLLQTNKEAALAFSKGLDPEMVWDKHRKTVDMLLEGLDRPISETAKERIIIK
jgi:hypothetical protein